MGGTSKAGGAGAPASIPAVEMTAADKWSHGFAPTGGDMMAAAAPSLMSMGTGLINSGGAVPKGGPMAPNPMTNFGLSSFQTQMPQDYLSKLKTFKFS